MAPVSAVHLPDVHTSALRRRVFTAACLLFAVGVGVAAFGIPSALTAWTTSGSEAALRTHYVVWGALAGVYLPGAALALARQPLTAPAQQLLAFLVAAAVGLVLALEPENAKYVAVFSLPVVALLALHPRRSQLLVIGAPDRAMLAVTALAAPPALAYAVANLRLSAATDYTHALHGGYAHAGILALTLLLAAGVGATHAPGWKVPAACATAGASMLGLAGLLFPDDPSSVSRAGGAALLLAAVIYAVLAIKRARAVQSRSQ